jgi:hypothetical protein
MKRRFIHTILVLFFVSPVKAQVVVIPMIGAAAMPEHGFLPGKKFQFYPTIDKYDFTGLKLRVELFDDRDSLKLHQVECSDIQFTNTSEFADANTIYIVKQYFDTLFKQSGAIIDSSSSDLLQARLEGIDARLIGFGSVRAHGLCQIKIKYQEHEKTYCVDITDADKHSPVKPTAFVTRKTGTRIIASASIREVIEQFLIDLKNYK